MISETKALEALLSELRACFNRLKRLAERLHADLDVSAPNRAVLEALARGGTLTVPEIAARRGVSRQHVQLIINALLDRSLVTSRANPTHKRSPQFALSDTGSRLFALIREREATVLAQLAGELEVEAVSDAGRVLFRLNQSLSKLDQEELSHEGEKDDES